MRLQRNRNVLLQRLGRPKLALCMVVGAFIGSVGLAGLLTSSQPNILLHCANDYPLATHSLCGTVPLAVIDELIPADMVYFQRRWK
jgi:hypothetical protein